MIDPLFILFFLAVTALGLALGSFATVLVHRIPLDQGWIRDNKKIARSCCPSCGHQLGIRDLVPLFSYLFLRGRCRYCSEKIPAAYWQVELTTVLACWIVFFSGGLPLTIVLFCLLTPFLVALLFIDLKHYILPDTLLLILAALGILYHASSWSIVLSNIASSDLWAASFAMLGLPLISAICYGGLAWILMFSFGRIMKREVMGFGDVKFFALAGLYLPIETMPIFLFIAGGVGTVMGLYYKHKLKEAIFPFGPALIIAFFISLINTL